MLVVDPGVFSEAAAALDGADAVLITHEHADHVDVARCASGWTDGHSPIHGPAALAEALDDAAESCARSSRGESFTAAGIAIRAYGGDTR